MLNPHIAPGILFLFATVLFFAVKLSRAHARTHFPWWGWAGLTIILSAEALLAFRVEWVATFFTPLAWTGYLLSVDATVASLKGDSLLTRAPREFAAMTICSVPLWVIFEAYNLRLQNWTYVGLPETWALRNFGYVWSFATIWPAIFQTADLVSALGIFSAAGRARAATSNSARWAMVLTGAILVAVPLAVPREPGRYLFGAVWIGFVLLIDPLNHFLGGYSFLRDFEAGNYTNLRSFLVAGWVCGILWEFWNYWAAAKWIYTFPIGQAWKVFEMPLAGYLGFLPFALECKVMYEFLVTLRKRFVPAVHLAGCDGASSQTR